MITVTGLKEFEKRLDNIGKKQLPFAIAQTLNQITYTTAKKELPKQADETFDGGATQHTKRAFSYKKAKKTHLTAEIYINPETHGYLEDQIKGGIRKPKGRAMIAPAQVKLNKYGNITKGKRDSFFNDKAKYFVGTPNGRTGEKFEGVWERYGRKKGRYQKIRKVASFIKTAKYSKKLPFHTIVEAVVNSRTTGFTPLFNRNFSNAILTAR